MMERKQGDPSGHSSNCRKNSDGVSVKTLMFSKDVVEVEHELKQEAS
jgi:hypothetical protein